MISGRLGGCFVAGRKTVRRALMVTARAVIGIVTGLVIAIAYWTVWLIWNGHSVTDAIQGRVEDALGTLQGIAALGTMIGAAVGLASAFVAPRSSN